jgi:threonine dehydrogenase-like Zn-dependent dehydrogenase
MRSLDQYYRSRSLWLDGVPGSLEPRPSLPDDIDVDVAIIGAGYAGLWTAYYLADADPALRVAVLDPDDGRRRRRRAAQRPAVEEGRRDS